MSEYIKYDPGQFVVERAQDISARLGEFTLGISKLGSTDTGAWVPVENASLSYDASYTPDDNGTLIFDSESVTVSMSYWDDAADPLYPADRIRARYGAQVLFLGTVSGTTITYSVDPDAADHQAARRVDLSAAAVGTYASALGQQVCWSNLPAELAIDRIGRWVTVANFGDVG